MNVKIFVTKVRRKTVSFYREIVEREQYASIAKFYDINGYRRIYHVHIRKTGGTSINKMFLSISGMNSSRIYDQLADSYRLMANGLIYVGWNVRLINEGNYFYAFSHTPFHQLNLPEDTFAFACFRDPAQRVISLYKMLMEYHLGNIEHLGMGKQRRWLGDGFNGFIEKIPREELLNQIYTFSENGDIDEAIENVLRLQHFFFLGEFSEGIQTLNEKLNLQLKPIHVRKSGYKAKISEETFRALREMLAPEYVFLERLQELSHYQAGR